MEEKKRQKDWSDVSSQWSSCFEKSKSSPGNFRGKVLKLQDGVRNLHLS